MKEDLVKRIFNCIPSRNIEKDWGVEHATEAGILQPTAAIPNAKDLRDTSWWSIEIRRVPVLVLAGHQQTR